MLCGNGVENLATANGFNRGVASDDKPIALHQAHRGFQSNLHTGGVSGGEFRPVQEHHMAEHFTGTGMESHPGSGLGGFGVAGEK